MLQNARSNVYGNLYLEKLVLRPNFSFRNSYFSHRNLVVMVGTKLIIFTWPTCTIDVIVILGVEDYILYNILVLG